MDGLTFPSYKEFLEEIRKLLYLYKYKTNEPVSSNKAVDVREFITLLQIMGFNLESLEKLESIIDNSVDCGSILQIEVKCLKSGLHGFLTNSIQYCSCPLGKTTKESVLPSLAPVNTFTIKGFLSRAFTIINEADTSISQAFLRSANIHDLDLLNDIEDDISASKGVKRILSSESDEDILSMESTNSGLHSSQTSAADELLNDSLKSFTLSSDIVKFITNSTETNDECSTESDDSSSPTKYEPVKMRFFLKSLNWKKSGNNKSSPKRKKAKVRENLTETSTMDIERFTSIETVFKSDISCRISRGDEPGTSGLQLHF